MQNKKCFRVFKGPARADGNGGVFMPYKQGTIEFFMKPNWNSAELEDGSVKRLIFAPMIRKKKERAGYLNVEYTVKEREKYCSLLLNSKYFNSELEKGNTVVRRYRGKTLFEKDKWVHVAIVWGPRDNVVYHPSTYKCGNNILIGKIYINGKEGYDLMGRRNSGKNSSPVSPLNFVQIGLVKGKLKPLNIAIDELRISNVQRYMGNFQVPSRNQKLANDSNTLALFHFDGNLKGETCVKDVPVQGKVYP